MKHFTEFLEHQNTNTIELSKRASKLFFDIEKEQMAFDCLQDKLTCLHIEIDNVFVLSEEELEGFTGDQFDKIMMQGRKMGDNCCLLKILMEEKEVFISDKKKELVILQNKILELVKATPSNEFKAIQESNEQNSIFIRKTAKHLAYSYNYDFNK
ncbi:hypothetical protein G1L03_01300 [Tenacibaculum finnmarkense]|uniref:hypothetical protein n=1 Tax=Tenacibaculum finnmarkense TaxID=2781243 RepID=UPI001EFC1FAE|nr:hypothetical protein [Tenacibaculum finnmarkense]MCG8247939.1 hypothetical protein [Tenacibaculum finnmarkense genomovar finnmarkense]MCG8791956.1 hypothetical protein [Tenacibaculum finnmarkense]MCG8868470.1 hypothetical protein [Tenacibaculum finnmarkense]